MTAVRNDGEECVNRDAMAGHRDVRGSRHEWNICTPQMEAQ